MVRLSKGLYYYLNLKAFSKLKFWVVQFWCTAVADVLKIAKETVPITSAKLIKRPNHRFSGQGITHRLSIENMLGRGTYGVVPGFGHHYQCNYHVHRLLGIGAGVGINTFIDLSFIPLYANLKGLFYENYSLLVLRP